MGWHMKFMICVQLAYVSVCLAQLSVVREWTSLDVQLAPEYGLESRRRSIMPSQVDSWLLYKNRMFVTLQNGEHEYYIAYLDLTDNSTSPLLRPYLSYENRQMIIIYEPYKVLVDRCDRLWVISKMNLGKHNIMIVFDLKTDSILKNSSYPERVTFLLDMAIDDFDCDNEYVYISSADAVWTYSWAEGDFWHHNIVGLNLISPMILAPNSIIYYSIVFELNTLFYMSTTLLRDKSNKTLETYRVPSRELYFFAACTALDAKSDVLYYSNYENKIHAVPCWTSERCSSNCQDVSIDPTHELKYITVDENGYLWAVTSRSSFEDGEINYRLLSGPVKSTCVESNAKDTTNTSTGVESNAKDTTNTSTGVESNAKDTTNTSTGVESNAKDTTNTSTGVESNAKDTTNTSTGVESNAKDTTNTTNINEITTPASSTTEQTSTLGSVPKHTTVNIADTTAGTPNSNITQAVGGTNVPYLLFSIANTTFNLSINFTITNFTNNYFH